MARPWLRLILAFYAVSSFGEDGVPRVFAVLPSPSEMFFCREVRHFSFSYCAFEAAAGSRFFLRF